MSIVGSLAPDVPGVAPTVVPVVRWHPVTRVAFRFCALYFTLYVMTTQMFSSLFVLPWVNLPPPSRIGALQSLFNWVAIRLGFQQPFVIVSGSGDRALDWAQAFTLVTVSAVLTIVWSVLDRRRHAYMGLHKWFRLFLRFALGATLVSYGAVKAFPLQMRYPALTRLLEPYGHFSLMGVLWAKIGASPAYEIFTGIVELSAAVLLFVPGLTLAGSLLSAAAMFQVFMLNMTYDVPVKLFSFHLVAMSLVLAAPDARRLLNVLVLNRAAPPSSQPPLFRRRALQTTAIVAQVVMGAWLVYSGLSNGAQAYATAGPHAPKPALYGIWEVETMKIDGHTRSPLVTDYDRFRRVVVQTAAGISFQRMDDTFVGYGAKVDPASRTIALTTGGGFGSTVPPSPAGRLTFDRPSADRLLLAGTVGDHEVEMHLRYVDPSNFRLVQGKFRWVQELPFNR